MPPQAGPGGEAESAGLGRLFARTCLLHAGDGAALRATLADRRYRPVPAAAARTLLARPGQAYRVSGEAGHLLVLLFDNGWCGDGGTGIDPHMLVMQLSDAIQAHGTTMRLMDARPDGNEQHYLLTRPAPALPLVLLVLLRPSGPLAQASLFAAPLPAAAGMPR